jgi:hypothetical protein
MMTGLGLVKCADWLLVVKLGQGWLYLLMKEIIESLGLLFGPCYWLKTV